MLDTENIGHLLDTAQQSSRFLRHMWHLYGGAPPLLEAVSTREARHEYRLGPDWLRGEHPHALVPPGRMAKHPEPRGLGRSPAAPVAPGFDFAGFEVAPDGFEP